MVLTELCHNAIEHGLRSNNGEVLVRVERSASDLVLEVIDDGAGLPDDFDLRGRSSLGLSIVSTLITDLDGEFTLSNNAGDGSTARVRVMWAHAQ